MDEKRMAGAIAGGLVAGLGITAMLMVSEKKSGKPSELTLLERTSAHKLGVHVPPDSRLPDATEQAVIQGGHLLLSAAAGAVFAATVDEEAGVIPAGVGFGLAFYAAMHWITGPLLGVKKPEWQSDKASIGMHTFNHVAFGLVTALGATAATRM
ncbi:hypothetical protein [Sphingomonas sp. R86520]|uniref:hypothetical protein n=1 Tax=Sphingomonas sp. R86520 TaxID=3093859 RepID=UPI0036D254CA